MNIKKIIFLLALLISTFLSAQVAKDSELFLALKKHDSLFFEKSFNECDLAFLEKAIQHIKDHIENTSFGVEQLADKMCLSPSQLHRKLQALIDQAPGQLIRNIRLQRAADLIKKNAGTLADICFQAGFNDQTYFSRAFKSQFGWHILQVLERRKEDMSDKMKRNQAANVLRARRFDEEFQLWLTQIREEAYVEIKL